jgi:hypothetical protein
MSKKGHKSHSELPRPFIGGREDIVELYYSAWDLAARHISSTPGLAAPDYMDEGFEPDKIWQWDSCFMSMFCRYAHELFPGIESLDNFYSLQRGDGYIGMSYNIVTGGESYPLPHGRVNPPLFSWAEFEHYKITGDKDRLARVLPKLLKYDAWLEANRRRGDGSYWFEDGGSSGMDNAPRTCRRNKKGNDVSWIDLAAQQALSALCLSKAARALGDGPAAEFYSAAHSERSAFINRTLWCEKDGFYYDRLTDGLESESYPGYFSACKTIASFWPLIAEAAPPERAVRLAAHLVNEREFGRPNPVPSLSYDNPNYKDSGGYWHGSVWAPTNYMTVRGLLKYGMSKLAAEITLSYLGMMDRARKNLSPGTLWECYSAETDAPASTETGERCRKDFVGWTGLGPIAMLIECVLGIDADYPAGTIACRPYPTAACGIESLRFGPHRVSLIFGERRSAAEPPSVSVSAPLPFKTEPIDGELPGVLLKFDIPGQQKRQVR